MLIRITPKKGESPYPIISEAVHRMTGARTMRAYKYLRPEVVIGLLGLDNILELKEFLSKSKVVHGAIWENSLFIHPDGVNYLFKRRFRKYIKDELVTGKSALDLGEETNVRRKIRL